MPILFLFAIDRPMILIHLHSASHLHMHTIQKIGMPSYIQIVIKIYSGGGSQPHNALKYDVLKTNRYHAGTCVCDISCKHTHTRLRCI